MPQLNFGYNAVAKAIKGILRLGMHFSDGFGLTRASVFRESTGC